MSKDRGEGEQGQNYKMEYDMLLEKLEEQLTEQKVSKDREEGVTQKLKLPNGFTMPNQDCIIHMSEVLPTLTKSWIKKCFLVTKIINGKLYKIQTTNANGQFDVN